MAQTTKNRERKDQITIFMSGNGNWSMPALGTQGSNIPHAVGASDGASPTEALLAMFEVRATSKAPLVSRVRAAPQDVSESYTPTTLTAVVTATAADGRSRRRSLAAAAPAKQRAPQGRARIF
ncbi:hypothetical protein OH779_14585 [Actinacidiphila glaucinigra]|uniref:hypothetical protein n=1 Tax=Actinacidiphila glaucinigra TaxID=235986 RepID=UPI00386938CB